MTDRASGQPYRQVFAAQVYSAFVRTSFGNHPCLTNSCGSEKSNCIIVYTVHRNNPRVSDMHCYVSQSSWNNSITDTLHPPLCRPFKQCHVAEELHSCAKKHQTSDKCLSHAPKLPKRRQTLKVADMLSLVYRVRRYLSGL